jgi:hypothetical protein
MPFRPKPRPRLTVTRISLSEQQREENYRLMFAGWLKEALEG